MVADLGAVGSEINLQELLSHGIGVVRIVPIFGIF
jgi:hypothetical protein